MDAYDRYSDKQTNGRTKRRISSSDERTGHVQGLIRRAQGTLTNHPFSIVIGSTNWRIRVLEYSLKYSDEYSSRKLLVSGSPSGECIVV